MSNNLTLDLVRKTDKNGKIFHVAKLKSPILIDASKGVVFLVFTSELGSECIQVANMQDNKDDFE